MKSFSTERKEIGLFDSELLKTYIIGKKKSLLYGAFIGLFSVVGFGVIVVVLYFGVINFII